MGGSAIGGDIARSLLESKLLVPFQICRNYVLPEYVDDETLVIASSYSGSTEETLAAMNDALNRKAMAAVLTTGGLLKDIAELNEIPVATLPEGFQPRAALGYSLIPLLFLLEAIGLIKNVANDVKAAVVKLQTFRDKYIEDNPTPHNPAKSTAQQLFGKIPVIYGGPRITDVAAVRWKGQICENAKTLAFANVFPEFNHNELVGWSDLIKQHAQKLVVVLLRDADDHTQVRKRMNVVKELIEAQTVETIEIHSRGDAPLERLLSLIQFGDFVSYYLAILNEVDPTPVEVIEQLKSRLKQMS
jgi:glucose/mannose-6-phosphate isomerase